MGRHEKEEWNIKTNIEYTLERSHILIQLRYQLAIATIVLITGVWTILFTGEQLKNDLSLLLLIGWSISVILVVCWRKFTHVIFEEELALNVTRLFCKNELGLILEKLYEYMDYEKKLELSDNKDFNSFDKIKKLKVMKKLKYNYPEKGIRRFDYISLGVIILSGIFLEILYFFINLCYSVIIPFYYYILIASLVSFSCLYIYIYIIKITEPNKERTKRAIKEVIEDEKKTFGL